MLTARGFMANHRTAFFSFCLVIVLLAPGCLAVADADLAVECDADGKIEGTPGFSASLRVSPREMRPAFGDFAKQLHHPDHGAVIEGDGINVGTTPAAAWPLLPKDVVETSLGRLQITPVFSGRVRFGKVADLCVGGVVVERAFSVLVSFLVFFDFLQSFERIPLDVLWPTTVGILE